SISGTVTIAFTYLSHVFVFTHTILKAMQVINRFTSLYFPMKHETKPIYIDVGTGVLKYAGMDKTTLQTAKIIIASVFLLFVIVTLPLNVLLLLKIRSLRVQSATKLQSEWMFFYYVVAITVAHSIGVVHQYAYPNFITTFTPPIALIIMSQHVRDGIQNFFVN
ncbi:hypothetical protein PFISCL1PPCAC_7128, partial [Pristionchus fissidentatus]